jgi:hydroxyacylglutathione hydrolase
MNPRIFMKPLRRSRALAWTAWKGCWAAGGGGIEAWRDQGLALEISGTISAQECAERMKKNEVRVLDVRDDNEREEKCIPGSLHTYVGDLEEKIPPLPKGDKLVVHCSVGHRAGLAASILKRSGFTHVFNLLGGIKAWEALNLPLDQPDQPMSRTLETKTS